MPCLVTTSSVSRSSHRSTAKNVPRDVFRSMEQRVAKQREAAISLSPFALFLSLRLSVSLFLSRALANSGMSSRVESSSGNRRIPSSYFFRNSWRFRILPQHFHDPPVRPFSSSLAFTAGDICRRSATSLRRTLHRDFN